MIAAEVADDLQRPEAEPLAEDTDIVAAVGARIVAAVVGTAVVKAEAATQDSSELMVLAVDIVGGLTMLAVGIAGERMLD